LKRTTAPNSSGGLHVDRVSGVSSGTNGTAEDRNNLQEEVCHAVLLTGVALDGTDQYQLEKAIIAISKPVGEVFDMAVEEEPVAWGAARNNEDPDGDRYFPAVKLWDANHDLAAANYPDLVAKLRAQKAKTWTGSAYASDHSVTVSGSTITGSGTAWDYLVSAIAEDALRLGSYQRTINVGGTDYAVTAATPGSHTLTVTGSPSSGAQTAIMYPYRIAGSTSARVFKDSGNASMSPDGARYVNGLMIRDRTQGHKHVFEVSGNYPKNIYAAGSGGTSALGYASTPGWDVGVPLTDGTNGTPRTGATTDPNASIRYRYMWAGTLL